MRRIIYLALIFLFAFLLAPLPLSASTPVVIDVWPSSGPVGTEVTVTVVTVYSLSGDYEVWWGSSANIDIETDIMIAEGRGDPGSQELILTVIVPESPYGANYVRFKRLGREEFYQGTFSISPSIEVSPTSATPRSMVTIIGTGFGASESCKMSLDGTPTDITIKTDDKGSFVAEVRVPDTMAGPAYNIEVASEKVLPRRATVDLDIVPGLRLTPEFPEVGGEVNIAGYGFAARSQVSIKYDDFAIASSPTTDATGNFSYDFNVPETSASQHRITVTDMAGNVVTLSLPLEGVPPPAPVTISPTDQRFGVFGSIPITFSWTEVSDPSGVSYTLEIADDLNFFPVAPGMRRSGLTETTCTLELKPGTYYWRVIAIDGAGNKGPWSLSPNAFKVGFISMGGLLVGGFVFLVVFILLIRMFFRRLREYYY